MPTMLTRWCTMLSSRVSPLKWQHAASYTMYESVTASAFICQSVFTIVRRHCHRLNYHEGLKRSPAVVVAASQPASRRVRSGGRRRPGRTSGTPAVWAYTYRRTFAHRIYYVRKRTEKKGIPGAGRMRRRAGRRGRTSRRRRGRRGRRRRRRAWWRRRGCRSRRSAWGTVPAPARRRSTTAPPRTPPSSPRCCR